VIIALSLLTVAATIGLLFAERSGDRSRIWLFKPLASGGFIGTAWASGVAPLLFAGMVLGGIGDVLLIRKEDKRWFLAGIIVFLWGHVAYLAAFLARGIDGPVLGGTLVVLALPALFVGRVLWARAGKLRFAVVAYIVVISVMLASATSLVATGAPPMIAVGALMFYLSDLCVARERFVAHGFVNKLFGQPLYFGAQLVIALWGGTA